MKIQTILLLVGTAIAMAPPYSEAELKAGKVLYKRCQAKGVKAYGMKAEAYYKCK
ncbi:hypothetical protein EG327_004129 [Venturia inaequalis]|uniref:Uncharacterized protein n=1 Tax=Venturia inaequalis TaxID=5025 RepID=A0A8H3ZET9_VENIN|nr:hypothetical protein EG327_004129 [Venturia inaequalis]